MGKGVKIPWVGGSMYTIERGSKYHGRGVNIPWIGGVKIPWVGGSIYHR